MTLSQSDKDLIRALLQARNPALLGLVDMLDLGALPVEQREAITRALGVERRMNREAWVSQSAEIERLMEYVWTSRPLAAADAHLLRKAIEAEEPSLLPLLDKIGTSDLTQDEANEMRSAIGGHLIATGFDSRLEWLNARGVRLEALIDYLVHCVVDWR